MSLKKGLFKKTALIFALVILIPQEALLHAQEYETADESTTTEEIITTEETITAEETSILDYTISIEDLEIEENTSYIDEKISEKSNTESSKNSDEELFDYEINEESLQKTSNSNEHFSSIQSGTQNAISDNLSNPLSAWKLTNASYELFSSDSAIPYSIRLEELYYGSEANTIVAEENQFNDVPSENQQWLLMKFYLKNEGSSPISASDIIWYHSFYTQKGASMIIRGSASFSHERNGMNLYDLDLEGGASGYFWVGILTEKEQGLPYIKLYNGYSDSEYTCKYSWVNTDPNYIYNPSATSNPENVNLPAENAISNNLKNPLSAWNMTYARTSDYSSTGIPYYIRLEEMYIGNEANTIVATENQFNDKPNENQQWILMKFYLKNAGTEPISASDIIWNSSLYTNSGASMIIKSTASFSRERCGMSVYDLELEGGADGYFWIGILVEKSQGLPYIKIENGYNKSEYKSEYSWLNTDPSYIYQSFSNTSNTSGSVDMYRLYNPNSGEHFYTASSSERDNLINVGWKYEGIGWKAPIKSNSPVYRLYNKNAGDHHYTMSISERDFLIEIGWAYEGIGWYSDDSQSVPLYRQYNPNAKSGSHNYTTNKNENDWLVSLGWKGEGIGWYGMK